MRFFIFSILLILGNSIALGQSVINKYLDPHSMGCLGRSLVPSVNGYLILGLGGSPLYPNQVVQLTAVDEYGNIDFANVYGSITGEHYTGFGECLSVLSDTSFVIAGTLAQTGTTNGQAFLLAINQSGDTLWNNIIANAGQDVYLGLHKYSDTLVYAYGYSQAGSTSNKDRSFLTLSDGNGSILWNQSYAKTGDTYVNDMAIIGKSAYFSGATTVSDGTQNPYLLKVKLNGDFLWDITLPSLGTNNYSYAIEATYDENVVYVGSKDTLINPTDFHRSFYVSKMDTNGSEIWRTYLNDSLNSAINEILVLPNNQVLFAGTREDSEFPLAIGWIGKLKNSGQVLWQRRVYLSDIGNDYFADLLCDDEKNIVLTGETYDTAIGHQLIWLVKLDSMGCLEPGCDTLVGIIDVSPPKEQVAVKVFPNPASEQATIVLEGSMAYAGEELEVYVWSLSGQLIQKKPFQINGALPVLKLERSTETSGIYLIDVVHKGKPVGSGKLIWE